MCGTYINHEWLFCTGKYTIKPIGAKIEKELKHVFFVMCIISIQVYAAVSLPLGFLCLQFSLKRIPVTLKSSMNSGFDPEVSQSAQCVSVFVCHCSLGNIIDFTPCFWQVSDPHFCTVCMFALCKTHWSSSTILLSINTVLVILVIIYKCSTES